jgi:hypothetical protein
VYSSIALLQSDTYFLRRCAGCVASEAVAVGDPWQWTVDNSWELAASPGFGEAYQYALDTGVQNPGNDETVITDAQILSAVQALETPASV